MAAQDPIFRVCPTRIDHAGVLFAHKVSTNKCQERQRQRYHKCSSCAWNNNYVAAHGVPVTSARAGGETPPNETQRESAQTN